MEKIKIYVDVQSLVFYEDTCQNYFNSLKNNLTKIESALQIKKNVDFSFQDYKNASDLK